MTRLSRSVPRRALVLPFVAVVAVASASCGTGTTTAPPQTAAPSPSAGSDTSADTQGFPTSEDGPALDAAKTFVEKATTYDHTKLADQRAAILPLAGEPLKGELTKSLADGGDFANSVTSASRDATGTVLDVGLVSREGGRAVVVLFVDQQITSPAGDTTQRLRERVTLEQAKNGAWLATKIETI